jgi:hypothetical protein
VSAERVDDDEARFIFGDILLEASRASDHDAGDIQIRALSFFEAQIQPKDFHIQRHAELLLDMAQPEKAEALLQAHREFDSSCWIQRLMARARLAKGDALTALCWINRALADHKCISRHDEFRELRYEIRRALRDTGSLDDLKAALELAPEGRRRARLQAVLATASGKQ